MIQKVKRNGMLTIPREIMQKLNIQVGDRVYCYAKGSEIIFKLFDPSVLEAKQ